MSESDAASRVFDAAKPLRDHGIAVLDALKTVAGHMRQLVRRPMTKGDLSSALTRRLDEPFVRFCRPCNATHSYEQPFRLAALQAGLELEPETSPPVLRRIPRLRPALYRHLGIEADAQFDVIRGYLRFFGPCSVRAIATFLDAPMADVTANLPADVVEVRVSGLDDEPPRYILSDDLDTLAGAADRAITRVVRLVGSHDPYLQLRDRQVLVDDPVRQKDLWRTLGRPGAVLVDGEVAGTWRPRASRKSLGIQLDPWTSIGGPIRTAILHEAERLAAHRRLPLGAVTSL